MENPEQKGNVVFFFLFASVVIALLVGMVLAPKAWAIFLLVMPAPLFGVYRFLEDFVQWLKRRK
jgi:hypothetical protein